MKVRKAATTKTVYVNYVDEDGNVPVENGHEQITIDKDATYFNASLLKSVPVGYELCSVGDISLGGSDSVNVMVRKSAAPEVKNVKINFYCPEEKKQVAEPTVVVNADATYVNSSAYAALVPAGYELAEVGDMPSVMAMFTLRSARLPPRPSRSTTTLRKRRSRSLRSR